MLKMFHFILLTIFICTEALSVEKEARGTEKIMVYSCSVEFPNDSDVFDPNRIKNCIKDIDPLNVTYVHVVATATTTGTAEHNLDLSNRRASAVGQLIHEAFPNVKDIHVFGGGQNPRLGRLARVFIIVQPPTAAGSGESPEPVVIHEVEVKQEIRYVNRYLYRPRYGFELLTQYGISDSDNYDFDHRYLSIGLRRRFFQGASFSWIFGAHLTESQSTMKRDFEAFHAEVGVGQIWKQLTLGDAKLFSEASLLSGLVHNSKQTGFDIGARVIGGVEFEGIRTGLLIENTYQLKKIGLVIGVDF